MKEGLLLFQFGEEAVEAQRAQWLAAGHRAGKVAVMRFDLSWCWERAPLFPGCRGTLLGLTHWVWSLSHFKGDVSSARKTKDWGCSCTVLCGMNSHGAYSPTQSNPGRRSPPPGCSGPGHSLQQGTETRLPLKIEDAGKEVVGSFPLLSGAQCQLLLEELSHLLFSLTQQERTAGVSRQFFLPLNTVSSRDEMRGCTLCWGELWKGQPALLE